MKLHLNIANPAVHNTVRVARIIVRRCVGRFITPAKSVACGSNSAVRRCRLNVRITRGKRNIIAETHSMRGRNSDAAALLCRQRQAELRFCLLLRALAAAALGLSRVRTWSVAPPEGRTAFLPAPPRHIRGRRHGNGETCGTVARRSRLAATKRRAGAARC